MQYRFHTLDVFTTERFGGNPLAVVLDAQALDDEAMQKIAREFNLSETTFVLPPADPKNTANVRIFTPGRELPFAGHPTVGTAILLAERNRSAAAFETEIRLEEKVGLIPVKVRRAKGEPTFARFTAAVQPRRSADAPSVEAVAAGIGLAAEEIGCGRHRPGVFSAGNTFLFVPVASRAALARARVAPGAWQRMLAGLDTVGAYLYTLGGEAPDASFRARLYAPEAGIVEDPATGSAAATLPGQILASEALGEGTHRWRIEQGYEMGRPSRIELEADVAGGAIRAVRVGGHAVRVSEGEITIDTAAAEPAPPTMSGGLV